MTKQRETYNYAKSVAKLEAIVTQLEDGGVELGEALILHAEGKKLAEEITTYLEKIGSEIHIQKTQE